MKQSTLGSCIRTLRMQNNLTQLQLAELLGVTDKAVSKWERDLSYPDIALFPKLADILGTTVDGLLRECKETCQPSKLLQAFEMSRDIRMPLHIILGCVEIIRNNHDDPEMLQKYLDGIKISSEYMMSMFDRILNEKCCNGSREGCCEGYSVSPGNIEKYLQERITSGQVQAQSFSFISPAWLKKLGLREGDARLVEAHAHQRLFDAHGKGLRLVSEAWHGGAGHKRGGNVLVAVHAQHLFA